MQNINEFAEPYSVNGSVRIGLIVLNNFENACTTKTRKRLS